MNFLIGFQLETFNKTRMVDTEFKILGSSSSGNAALLRTSELSILIDAGLSFKKLQFLLNEEGINAEELGVSLEENELLEILRVSPCLETGNEFVRVYVTKQVISPVPDKEEVFCLEAMNLEQIKRKIKKEGEQFSKSFLHLFPLVVGILERLH